MPKLIDLTGKQFDRLIVIKKAYVKINNRPAWVCKCSCGNPNEIIVSGNHLRTGHTRSCGCLHREITGQKNFVDITGQKFGKLTAIKNIGSNKKGNALWECKCDCGNIIIAKGIELRFGHILSCGCLKSKGEELIIKILLENNINFKQQKTYPTCKYLNGGLAKFDFCVNDNYLIEYDGK